jgi:hypothetical protein
MLCINDNVEAVSARLLKDRSPIIDIEHTFLYSPTTIARIFLAHGFQVKRVGSVWNKYTLFYLVRLIPFPALPKRIILALLKDNPAGRIPISAPLGNLYLIAKKP